MDLAEVIVVIGGCDRKGLLKLPFADTYHPESQRWTPLPSLPGYTRSEFASCALRNDIYVSGEGTSEVKASCFHPPPLIFPPIGSWGPALPYPLHLVVKQCSPAKPVTGGSVDAGLGGPEALRLEFDFCPDNRPPGL